VGIVLRSQPKSMTDSGFGCKYRTRTKIRPMDSPYGFASRRYAALSGPPTRVRTRASAAAMPSNGGQRATGLRPENPSFSDPQLAIHGHAALPGHLSPRLPSRKSKHRKAAKIEVYGKGSPPFYCCRQSAAPPAAEVGQTLTTTLRSDGQMVNETSRSARRCGTHRRILASAYAASQVRVRPPGIV
jgi:hypothetical protein